MITILQGDCIEQMKTMPEKSVQCCVTSPPYWGLRDYGTASWEGGSAECDHIKSTAASKTSTLKNDGRKNYGSANYENSVVVPYRDECGKCGAVRIDQQIGLEPTPREFVAKMVAVFAEVWRVLKDDGTLWLNLGDSYCSVGGIHEGREDNQNGVGAGARVWREGSARADGKVREDGNSRRNRNGLKVHGLKPKDLVGIPWRVAFALQEAGWYLRSDIIWSKPNPMPESVTDRPTKAHEYIFLLTKSERYYYDAEAVKEPASPNTNPRRAGNGASSWNGSTFTNGKTLGHQLGRTQSEESRKLAATGSGTKNNPSFDDAMAVMPENRNKRSVWTVPSAPYKEAHFATYPPDLIKPCILAGSRPGDMILDPFGGSGTTGQVANELGRNATLIELNPEYVKLIERRTDTTPGLGL